MEFRFATLVDSCVDHPGGRFNNGRVDVTIHVTFESNICILHRRKAVVVTIYRG